MAKARARISLALCLLAVSGCLGQRLTASEVVLYTQRTLAQVISCHCILDIEMNTDLIQERISVEVWEKSPSQLKVRVISAVNPQLRELVFVTDGSQSTSYAPHSSQALTGPANVVKMPSVIERLIGARGKWIESSNPQEARMVARERESGLVVYKIEVPLGESGQAQYWIDAHQWWVRRVTYQDEYLGSGTIQIREISCASDAGSILSDAEFEANIPDEVPVREVTVENNRPLGLQEAQMVVPFPLRTPSYLPGGTFFQVAYQLEKNIALVYAGQHPFTLVQGPGIGDDPQGDVVWVPLRGQQALVIRDAEHDAIVLTWREEELQFSVAGSLDQEEAVRIAESLEPAFKTIVVERGNNHASD